MTTNSPKAWALATRPRTLTGAIAPVLVALAAAWHDRHDLLVVPALLCALFALFMQVNANFINDYFDFKNGTDGADRLGPERACQQGWITMSAMLRGIVVVTTISCLIGLPLLYWGGWTMILVGVACVVCCFLYTTLLSHLGMGDLLVVVFFGFVPVCCTYYLQCQSCPLPIYIYGLAMGLVTDALLLVNNYRDRESDRRCGKKTLAVLLGKNGTETLYLFVGVTGYFLAGDTVVMLPFLIFHLVNYNRMRLIGQGRELNKVLARTAASILVFALLLCVSLLFRA
ncbi:MAG: 1,4-dihydroxy-2-naphthoate octaprenyltransferase [Bacteroidaceae bacterium]|nr:1,4-dihydroxy-2-naphthoate octaprenyltransferase [Bacteroidaceae bacterium]